MPKPVHVSVMQLTRTIQSLKLKNSSLAIELPSNDYETLLTHLQSQPGRANQPTDIEADSFKLGDVKIRRV